MEKKERESGNKTTLPRVYCYQYFLCLLVVKLLTLWPLISPLLRLRPAAVTVNYIVLTGNYQHIKSSH